MANIYVVNSHLLDKKNLKYILLIIEMEGKYSQNGIKYLIEGFGCQVSVILSK